MVDPLAEIVSLLQPRATASKLVDGAGAWRMRRAEPDRVYYFMVLTGRVCLEADGRPPVTLGERDFVLIPPDCSFAMSSLDPKPRASLTTTLAMRSDGSARIGRPDGPAEVRYLVGHCVFGSPDAGLLVTLLPDLIVVRGEDRLDILAKLVADEARTDRPGREVVLQHLLEILLIETLRSAADITASPGLLRGLADARLSAALRCLHAEPGRNWTIAELAHEASLSRSAFFARFNRTVGMAPMDYLLRWRMTLAKDLLLNKRRGVTKVASIVGYGSASAFSVAFSRQTGQPPAHYARAMANSAAA